jgi:CubicO group peptidase (beta-lactamase class C family)
MAMAVDRGYFSYDEPICLYWPEFAANGKEIITIKNLLQHEAGLGTPDGILTKVSCSSNATEQC